MKSIKTLLSVLAFSLVLTSCSKDDDGGAASGNGSMTAKVDGTSYSASLAVQATLSGTTLVFGGTGSAGQITIALNNYTAPGTFAINGSSMVVATFAITTSPFTAWVASMVGGSGSVTVSEVAGGYVKGSFNFTGINTGGAANKVITEGQFNIKLQ